MSDDLTLATTTDDLKTADAALSSENIEDARVPVEQHGSLSEFKHSESEDGTKTLSYEHPSSSRIRYAEQLAEAEKDLAQLSVPAEPEAKNESADIDIEAVRQAATQQAIKDGQEWAAQQRAQIAAQQQPTINPELRQEYSQALETAKAGFDARIQEIRQADPAAWEQVARQVQGINFAPAIGEALVALPGGADVAVYLARHPQEARSLAQLPESIALARVGQLAAQMAPRPVSRSYAVPPITPVRGSSTQTSVPLDQSDFQTYKRVREQQIRARHSSR